MSVMGRGAERSAALLDHLVGVREQLCRHVKTKCLRSLHLDDELEPGRMKTGRVAGFSGIEAGTFLKAAGFSVEGVFSRALGKICPIAKRPLTGSRWHRDPWGRPRRQLDSGHSSLLPLNAPWR
jgi:hypothetical protein